MLSLNEARQRIEKIIATLDLPSEPATLYEPMRYILENGGKRLRPSLVLMGANLFSDEIEDAINPAIAVEIFHNFTLLHDDLMDNSAIRRGKQTVHLKWNPDIAILSGDAMSFLAGQYVSKVPPEILPEVLESFNRTAIEVCEGQMLDMSFEEKDQVSIEAYFRMIELKTSVLIAASLEMGAYCGGASESEARELYEFGRLIGIAFQLQDDYLDSYGDTETFGKKIGNDILTNKKTFLMISALENADSGDKKKLMNWFTEKDFDPNEKIIAIKKIFAKYDVAGITREKIRENYHEAIVKLDNIQVPGTRKKNLKNFAETLMTRKS